MAKRRTTKAQDERSRGDRATVEIIVVDLAEKAVTTAAVALTPATKGARIPLKFDGSRQLYRGAAPPGRYTASDAGSVSPGPVGDAHVAVLSSALR